jgi:hypothetical protein
MSRWWSWVTLARFKDLAEGSSHLCLVVAAFFALLYGVPILQAEKAKTERDESAARALIAKREAAEKTILEIGLAADWVGRRGVRRHMVVTLDIANTGNKDITLNAEDLQGHVARIREIGVDGKLSYEERRDLRFGSNDDTELKILKISPGEKRKLRTVQAVSDGGLYFVTAKAIVAKRADGSQEVFHSSLFAQTE